jgi:hypothetical protein
MKNPTFNAETVEAADTQPVVLDFQAGMGLSFSLFQDAR